MKKLHLDVDALQVETFDTRGGFAPRGGTVRGLSGDGCQPSYPEQCFPATTEDPGAYSCAYQTCAGSTCYASCVNCGSAGCGTFGCPTAADPTCSPRDASCVNLCVPPTG